MKCSMQPWLPLATVLLGGCGEAIAPLDGGAEASTSSDASPEATACPWTPLCDGVCTSLMTSSQNCGRCGHHCGELGFSGCSDGTCGAADVIAGGHFTCVTLNGRAYECWGSNASNVIDATDRQTVIDPEPENPLAHLVTWAAGARNFCVQDDVSGLRCRGPNDFAQNGGGNTTGTSASVIGFTAAESIAIGDEFACLVSSGTVYCWGRNDAGQLGDGTTTDRAMPAPVASLTNVVQVVAGARHACARDNLGNVYCWGARGLVGDGTTDVDRTTPVMAAVHSYALVAGSRHTCTTDRSTGTILCWGANDHGQLGNGTTTNSPSPTRLEFANSIYLAAGDAHTCSLASDSTLRCWGYNAAGNLGDGTTEERHLPVAVIGLQRVRKFSAGGSHTCAVVYGSEVYCWGENQHGELHDGTTIDRATPVRATGI